MPSPFATTFPSSTSVRKCGRKKGPGRQLRNPVKQGWRGLKRHASPQPSPIDFCAQRRSKREDRWQLRSSAQQRWQAHGRGLEGMWPERVAQLAGQLPRGILKANVSPKPSWPWPWPRQLCYWASKLPSGPSFRPHLRTGCLGVPSRVLVALNIFTSRSLTKEGL